MLLIIQMLRLIPNTYRIWYGKTENGEGDRKEIARAKAYCISDVLKHAEENMIDKGTNHYQETKFDHKFIIISPCEKCGLKYTDPELCEDCNLTEFIEIEKNNDIPERFKLPSGEELFHDLTIEPNKRYAHYLIHKHAGSIEGEIPQIDKDEIYNSIIDGLMDDERT